MPASFYIASHSLYSCHTGPLKLIKGSIASSPRQKRNARKRSFEESLSATAAKIVKLEQDRKEMETVLEPVVSGPSHCYQNTSQVREPSGEKKQE